MRHEIEGSVAEFAAASRVPVLNGGDGANEHPSQALLDLYTIDRELRHNHKPIDKMTIALVGDLRFGRAVHSLCKLLSLFESVQFSLVSPKRYVTIRLHRVYAKQRSSVSETSNLQEGISHVTSFTSPEPKKSASIVQRKHCDTKTFPLNQAVYTEFCQPNTVIMHPLPRDSRAEANELDNDLNDNPNLAIFRQTDNGALFEWLYSHWF